MKIRTTPATVEYLSRNKDRHLEVIREFLRQPSVPSDDIGVREGADLLASYYRRLGCTEVELVPSEGYPGVWAYYDAGAQKTLVSYAMFDTKLATPDAWSHPPFEAAMVDLPSLGRAVLGPGAKGRKAPYAQFLNALETLKAIDGELPVNLMFLAEGEENLGSPHYASFVERYSDRLREGSACHCPGAAQSASGEVTINLGFKGLLYLRLVSSGKRSGRGPQATPSHGMAQVIVDSPVWRLLSALGTLTTDDGRRITVDGFYDDYQPPTADEVREIRELIARRGGAWQKTLPGIVGARTSYDKLSNEEAWLRYMYEPSFNINGLNAGYVGPGSRVFTLPEQAWALLDVRVPRGFSAARTVDRIRVHLQKRGYEDIDLQVLAAHEPMRTGTDNEFLGVVLELLSEAQIPVNLMPTTGGGGPWSLMLTRFGMPVLFDVGLGHGGKAGEPDEYLVIERGQDSQVADLIESEAFYVEMLRRWAAGKRTARIAASVATRSRGP
jgi:acetylornithine deacetylase/succinyl-diaminopimelate desuccinylase-like protein